MHVPPAELIRVPTGKGTCRRCCSTRRRPAAPSGSYRVRMRVSAPRQPPDLLGDRGEHLLRRRRPGHQRRHPPQRRLLLGEPAQLHPRLRVGDRGPDHSVNPASRASVPAGSSSRVHSTKMPPHSRPSTLTGTPTGLRGSRTPRAASAGRARGAGVVVDPRRPAPRSRTTSVCRSVPRGSAGVPTGKAAPVRLHGRPPLPRRRNRTDSSLSRGRPSAAVRTPRRPRRTPSPAAPPGPPASPPAAAQPAPRRPRRPRRAAARPDGVLLATRFPHVAAAGRHDAPFAHPTDLARRPLPARLPARRVAVHEVDLADDRVARRSRRRCARTRSSSPGNWPTLPTRYPTTASTPRNRHAVDERARRPRRRHRGRRRSPDR